jgi:hypothetical protein
MGRKFSGPKNAKSRWLMSYGQTVYVKTRKSVRAFESDDMIGTHSADFIMGTGTYPVKDAGYMD